MLYDLYGVAIWRDIHGFYKRGGGDGLGNTATYNNMELTNNIGPINKYWFELVRRQARYGLATMCIGVGQGISTVVENLQR